MFETTIASQGQLNAERQLTPHFHASFHPSCDQDIDQHNSNEACPSSSSSARTNQNPSLESNLDHSLDRSAVSGSHERLHGNIVNVVAKRNARERTRVHTVNQAFMVLKTHIPEIRSHTKRVSKLKILRAAINHIDNLVRKLKTDDFIPNMAQPLLSKSVAPFPMCDSPLLNNHNFQPYMNMHTLLDYPSYIYPTASTTQQLLATHPLFLSQNYSSTS